MTTRTRRYFRRRIVKMRGKNLGLFITFRENNSGKFKVKGRQIPDDYTFHSQKNFDYDTSNGNDYIEFDKPVMGEEIPRL